MSQTYRTFIKVLALMASIAGLSACNTIEGLGKDIKSAGQSIENAADRKK